LQGATFTQNQCVLLIVARVTHPSPTVSAEELGLALPPAPVLGVVLAISLALWAALALAARLAWTLLFV